MNPSKVPETYFGMSNRALIEAKELFANQHTEGACSRAYYAMFNAARAALLIVGMPGTVSKRHDGLISAFGQHIVLAGHVDKEFGRSLNDIQHLRMTADYIGDPPSMEDTALAIQQAEAFVIAVQKKFRIGLSGDYGA